MENKRLSSRSDGVASQSYSSWDVDAISRALQQAPQSCRDIAHGPGVRYDLADDAVQVELFPPHVERGTGIIRLTTADSRQEFYRQPQPALHEEGLVFETPEHLISLSPTGELMTSCRVREEGRQTPPDAREDDDKGSDAFDDAAASGGDSRTSGRPFSNAFPETKRQPRVTYAGRLGTDPRMKTTPKGTFVMEFPVAVAVEGQEKPEWKSTVVFDEKARKLAGVLEKGTAVEVVAYEHRRVSRDPKTGQRRERRQYYATAVTPKLRSMPATEVPPPPTL